MYHNKCYTFFKDLEDNLLDFSRDYSNIVILCIGTDKILGDSIGPIIGEKLKYLENEYVKIYGNLENTINFNNAKEVLQKIYSKFDNPYIITIDAALSNKENVGKIVLNKGYIKIGKALEKTICFYSNLNIKCIVGKNSNSKFYNMLELTGVNIKEIIDMSNIVTSGIERLLAEKVY